MRTRQTLLFVVVATAMLGACHKHREPPPEENQQVEAPPPVEQTQVPPTEQPEPVAPKPAAPKVTPAPKPTADQQMLDDADATGMTSHSGSDTDTAGSSDNGQQ